jgi:phosphoribosyl-ATP pyrophosphohydrolase/phosphoribosyl-AMP cyclohydrolase/histidinol dehydrogenase
MEGWSWRRLEAEQVESLQRDPVDAVTLSQAAMIVDAVRLGGESSVREYAQRFGDLTPGRPLLLESSVLDVALQRIAKEELAVLERTADRIGAFARAQKKALSDSSVEISGGQAGHTVAPVERAGCYAPGGRYPLPSSVLMTAVTAREAGVDEVWVASPRPSDVTLAAAAVAGADGVLACGGAHAIAALAYGVGPLKPCDVVVGPGNRWVTAAKQLVCGRVGIDMLAGPSELVILADGSADPATAAADLLAQAEHDPDALPALVTTDSGFADAVENELAEQLAALPTRDIASRALANGFLVVAGGIADAIAVCDRLAPEHLQIMCAESELVASQCRHYGALFVGSGSAEVLGDYGAGPNHTLPTGGVARFKGGLSVYDFLRIRTWLRVDTLDEAQGLVRDATMLARVEGLEGHARAAERRRLEE